MPPLVNLAFMAQGLFLSGNGMYMLALPGSAAQSPQLKGTPKQVMTILGTSTLSLGAFYMYSAYVGDRGFMRLSIFGRAMAVLVFLQAGGPLRGVAVFEGLMGLVTGVLLWREQAYLG